MVGVVGDMRPPTDVASRVTSANMMTTSKNRIVEPEPPRKPSLRERNRKALDELRRAVLGVMTHSDLRPSEAADLLRGLVAELSER